MKRLVYALLFTGCTITEQAVPPPEIRMEPLPAAPIERVESCLLPAPREPVAYTPEKTRQTVKPNRTTSKPFSPGQLITTATRQARIEPDEKGFFGGTAELTYTWQPGKIFTVYLSKAQATAIVLPVGDELVSGMYLDPEQFEVKTELSGKDGHPQSVVIVRPLGDKGEVDTFLLTHSGRRYLLHLTVGTVGMLVVQFEGPALPVLPPTVPTVIPMRAQP